MANSSTTTSAEATPGRASLDRMPQREKRLSFELEGRREGNPSEQPLDLQALKGEVGVRRALPYAQYEYVSVTFNATANADTDIRHNLQPPTAEDIDWQVVGLEFSSAPATIPIVYRDASATRRPWGDNFLVLRSNVSSLTATLLLTVRPRRVQSA